MKILTWILRLGLAAVFIADSIPKIMVPHDFATIMFHYQMLPHSLINLAAIFLPWLEFIVGICLIVAPPLRQGCAILLLIMLIVFTTAIGINLYRGIDITCGCFSVSSEGKHIGWLNIGRNISFILAAGFLARREARR